MSCVAYLSRHFACVDFQRNRVVRSGKSIAAGSATPVLDSETYALLVDIDVSGQRPHLYSLFSVK